MAHIMPSAPSVTAATVAPNPSSRVLSCKENPQHGQVSAHLSLPLDTARAGAVAGVLQGLDCSMPCSDCNTCRC